jgi:integrase
MSKLYDRDGIYYADLKYIDVETGKRKRKQRSTGIKIDGTKIAQRTAEINANELERSLALGKGIRARQSTLGAAYLALIKQKREAGMSAATIGLITEKSVHPLRFFGKGSDPQDVTEERLQEYAAYARQSRAAGTVHAECVRLRGAMLAVGLKPPDMPALGKIYTPRELWFDSTQTAALIAELPEHWHDHVITYRQWGLTWSELYHPRVCDMYGERNVVRVRGTKTETRDRNLPMPKQVREICERRAAGKGANTLLFPDVMENVAGNCLLTRAALRADLIPPTYVDEWGKERPSRVSFNVLRASFCTELVLKNVALKKIAYLMGHKTTKMVEAVYTRLRGGEEVQDAVDLIDNY